MSSYRVFCNDCGTESFISFIDKGTEAKFCPNCGSELDESNVDSQEQDTQDEDDWEALSREVLDDLDGEDDWKINK
jgi:hypothetical protein